MLFLDASSWSYFLHKIPFSGCILHASLAFCSCLVNLKLRSSELFENQLTMCSKNAVYALWSTYRLVLVCRELQDSQAPITLCLSFRKNFLPHCTVTRVIFASFFLSPLLAVGILIAVTYCLSSHPQHHQTSALHILSAQQAFIG